MLFVRTVIALALLAVAPLVAAPITTAVPHGGYSIRTWQTEDGLPQNTVTAITQTRDGYIWIGTFGGLARFDGERFKNFEAVNTPNLTDSRIASLFEDSQGVLWIGHDSGKVTRYRGGKFEPFISHSGSHEKVTAIGASGDGQVWLVRQNGVLESATTGELIPSASASGTVSTGAFARSAEGTMWVAPEGEASRFRNGKLQPINFGGAQQSGYVMGIGAAADGGLWVMRDGRVRKWKDGWTEDRGRAPWRESSITAVIELRDRTLAVGTMDDGFYLIFPDDRTLHFDISTGLAQNWVRYLYEDREGNLWVGAGTGGLAAVRPTAFTVLNSPDQWQGRAVLSVAPDDDGALWIGTEGAGLYRHLNGSWKNYGSNEGIKNAFIWSVTAARGGRLWVGTWGGGIFQQEGGRFVPMSGLENLVAPVLALHFNEENQALWIGTGVGLLRSTPAGNEWSYRAAEGQAPNICTLAHDDRGNLWFGLSEGGLMNLRDGQIARYRKTEGLSSNSVQCLLADGDTLWIGTPDAGLNRYRDGKFSRIGMSEGLVSNVICHIEDDGRGFLWLSTHHGILRLAKAELHACADGRISRVTGQVYDRNDGLPTIEYSGGLQAAGCKTTDGRLWFTSSKGLVSVDPANIRLNPIPPPVVIETLRVDGVAIDATDDARAALQLAPDHQRLEFEYTGLSLAAANKVLFKYRLVGLDKGWVNAGSKRTAVYSHLPPGDYRFEVIACNNDNVWNTTGAAFAFSVQPFYWQTWWFRTAVVVSALTLVGWGVRHETRRRLHLRLEQLERERAVEAERARIAQDIHDDIGASLTRITMLSQSVRGESAPVGTPTAEVLESICRTTQEVTRSLEEIVWAINPRHDTVDSLVAYMGKFAHEVISAAKVRCRLDLPVDLPAWPLTTQTRHNVLLAFKEALHNAVRHSGATEIQVTLKLLSRGFEISVEDNGNGFDAGSSTLASERGVLGNGLRNMHLRLAEIGGRCEITSAPGQGAFVRFTVSV